MRIGITEMERRHLESVLEIEACVFPDPWSTNLFLQELDNDCALSYVAADPSGAHERVIGYITAWIVCDECTINRIACHHCFRHRGVGSALLAHLMQQACRRGARRFVLEVRRTNSAARAFYRRFQFVEYGSRRKYYAENGEDAVVMVREEERHLKSLSEG